MILIRKRIGISTSCLAVPVEGLDLVGSRLDDLVVYWDNLNEIIYNCRASWWNPGDS